MIKMVRNIKKFYFLFSIMAGQVNQVNPTNENKQGNWGEFFFSTLHKGTKYVTSKELLDLNPREQENPDM